MSLASLVTTGQPGELGLAYLGWNLMPPSNLATSAFM
jgi:hypothetical protein